MTERSFLDTNVLVYAFDDHEPAKQDIARRLLREAVMEGWGRTSVQVLQEFYVTATRKLRPPLPHEDAQEAVAQFAELPLIPVDEGSVLSAVARCGRESISLWDSMIVQAAAEGGCRQLLTEDLQDGRLLGGVRITNPF